MAATLGVLCSTVCVDHDMNENLELLLVQTCARPDAFPSWVRLFTVILQCICQHLRTIHYEDKQRQLCEIQFAWSLNPTWHNKWGMHISLNWPRLKSCQAVFDKKIAPAPDSSQSLDWGMHAVRSHVTKIWGANDFMDSIVLFCETSYHKKLSKPQDAI